MLIHGVDNLKSFEEVLLAMQNSQREKIWLVIGILIES